MIAASMMIQLVSPFASQADQPITIKAAGRNTAPVVNNVAADTLTAEPVDIVLTSEDADFLDGRFDPLSFRISERPANGEFVAPLYPFFIEDYRTAPGGPYGQPFLDASNPNQWLYKNVCQVLPGPDSDDSVDPQASATGGDSWRITASSAPWRWKPAFDVTYS